MAVATNVDFGYGAVFASVPAMLPSQVCTEKPKIGDKVVILGYPGIGAQDSVTATEGIISGFDANYYTTSAKIEKGNSGGAAIDVERNCFLGLPTLVITGQIESLARILPVAGL
jgi:S1-C subfamily serine protease